MSVNVLGSLPSSLQIEIYTKWLEMKDVGRLDSAVQGQVRSDIFCVWAEINCIFDQKVYLVDELFALWVARRGIRISRAKFEDNILGCNHCAEFFQSASRDLKELYYTTLPIPYSRVAVGYQGFVDGIALCHSLRLLSLGGVDMRAVRLQVVLTNCTQLTDLTLPFASFIDLKQLNRYGQHLTSLTFFMCTSCTESDDFLLGRGYYNREPQVEYATNTTLRTIVNLYPSMNTVANCVTHFIISNIGLEELFLDRVDEREFSYALTKCPKLHTLSIRLSASEDSSSLSVENARYFVKLFSKMVYLQLSKDCEQVYMSEEVVMLFIEGCKQLVVFISHEYEEHVIYKQMRDGSQPLPKEVSAKQSQLQTLHVCSLTANALSKVLHLCPHLSELSVKECGSGANTQALLQLLHNSSVCRMKLTLPDSYSGDTLHLLSNLDVLHLHNCPFLTNESIVTIIKNNPNLTELVLYDCSAQLSCKILLRSIRNYNKEYNTHVCSKLVELRINCAPGNDYFANTKVEEKLKKLIPSLQVVEVVLP